jgi:hypothetical protein
MVTYVLNTLITPVDFDEFSEIKIRLRRISVEEARQIISDGFISAVGHEGTARLLSQLLGIQIPAERRTIFMRPGDKAIHFFLKVRLPEGVILDEEQLRRLDYWLVLSEVQAP